LNKSNIGKNILKKEKRKELDFHLHILFHMGFYYLPWSQQSCQVKVLQTHFPPTKRNARCTYRIKHVLVHIHNHNIFGFASVLGKSCQIFMLTRRNFILLFHFFTCVMWFHHKAIQSTCFLRVLCVHILL